MKVAVSIAALASTLLVTAPTGARTWHVSPDGTGDAPTIQAAMDSAVAGDEVLLAAGTYTWTTQRPPPEQPGESMVEVKAGVSLRGEAGPEGTILDAELQGRVILCDNVGDVHIEGLTVTGGQEPFGPGGGIYSLGNSRPTISNCIVHSNEAYYAGGGIYAEQASINDCQIYHNVAHDLGGGIYIGEGSVSRCTVRGNRLHLAQGGGGGIWAGNVTIVNCDISYNAAGPGDFAGGGILIGTGGSIQGSKIVNNHTFGDFNVGAGGIAARGTGITDCVIAGNSQFSGNWEPRANMISDASVTSCTILDAVSLGGTGMVHNSIINVVECSGAITFACSNFWFTPLEGIPCGIDAGGNFSADPQFCAENPAASLNFALQADSPCAPGHHPDGASCGLIGAAPVGCAAVSVETTTWSRLKSLYR